MKKNYIIALLTLLGLSAIYSLNNRLFAQDKQEDFKLGSGIIVYKIAPCGDEDFFIEYGKTYTNVGGIALGVVPLEFQKDTRSIMKFDKNLKPAWKEPINITKGTLAGVDFFSYTNPIDKTTISYLYDVTEKSYYEGITNVYGPVGAEEFIQVLPNGSNKAIKTGIPKKELQSIVAVFTELNGFNIITLTGDKKNLTGNMNWYVFSHDKLTMTKKNIVLPIPTGINKDNESKWWLNQATPDGLYFSYISHKNKVKAPGPILSCNIIKVNSSGKPGNLITLDLNYDKYSMMPAYYSKKIFMSSVPSIYKTVKWRHNSNFSLFLPRIIQYISTSSYSDGDTYMGVQVDATNNRIYTIIAGNNEFKVIKDGSPDYLNSFLSHAYPIKFFEASVYDMTGKKINQSIVDYTLAPENSQDDMDYTGNIVSLNLLQNNEGIVFKALNNGKGYIFSVNKDGKVETQNKFDLFSYKEGNGQRYKDLYPAFYTTKKDFENSPYIIGNLKSPETIFCNKMDKKVKPEILFLSLKSGNVFAIFDSKNDLVKLAFFNK